MRIVHHEHPDCGCHAKLRRLEQEQAAAGTPLCVRSQVECDCRVLYVLVDDQRGSYWKAVER